MKQGEADQFCIGERVVRSPDLLSYLYDFVLSILILYLYLNPRHYALTVARVSPQVVPSWWG